MLRQRIDDAALSAPRMNLLLADCQTDGEGR